MAPIVEPCGNEYHPGWMAGSPWIDEYSENASVLDNTPFEASWSATEPTEAPGWMAMVRSRPLLAPTACTDISYQTMPASTTTRTTTAPRATPR